MALPVSVCGSPKNLSASGNIVGAAGGYPVGITGFYVNSTSGGTLVIKAGGSSGTALTGTITPAIGWHWLPLLGDPPLHATIAVAALDVTFSTQAGA